ncbi:ribonuclease HII [Psychroserpens algicola]|uniref:ribonuclease HII n=1 Tax=Psychroserpens algicola TaxID=1719034 RepID=UPI0019549AF1|nr:ribonuclease HII [Psychroserpens algicola]
MKNIWCIVFCLLCLYNCENSKSSSTNPLSLVPDQSEIIIKINSAEGLENGLKNNALIKAITSYKQVEGINDLILPVHHINKDYSLITLSKDKNDSLAICFIVPLSQKKLQLDSISGLKIDTIYNNRNGISKLYYKGNPFFSRIIDSTFFVSNTLKFTQNATANKAMTSGLELLEDISNTDKMVSIYVNHTRKQFNPVIFKDSTLNRTQFSNYTILDSDISQNAIYINGVTKAIDSTKSLINVFKNTIPQENKIASIVPSNTESFKSLTFNDFEIFRQNLIRHRFQDSTTTQHNTFQNTVEIGQASVDNHNIFLLRSIDPESMLNSFDTQTVEDEFRSINIYTLKEIDVQNLSEFTPFMSNITATNFIQINDFFVFSDNSNILKHFITNYQNKTTLTSTEDYQDLQLELSDEASLLLFGNSDELNALLNLNFTDDKNLNISDFKTSVIQYVYDTDFAHINAIFKTSKGRKTKHSVAEEFNISIDANLATSPQFVKNHTTNQMDIAVQDINNNLYLISNKGKVFWKKQIDGKILGKIEQIDTYKNGRLQLVFNSSKRLYVLDRNGKDVNNFPLTFNDDITQPVSVFDYDKKKNYRLMVTQGKSVLMYDKNGKIVKGFTYTSAPNTITSQPKHFRINRKDFIVFSSGNQLEILDRVGKTRVKVKENISFSNNNIYLYNNKFTTSNTNGELLEVNQSGRIDHKNLNVNSDHKLATTSKTLVVLNDNKLTIKSKTIELDFGDYTAPKIFYINDKIYVTVTDLQSKKGYLFDSQAKPIANFPVYANSELELSNIDKDNALEVVTKGDDNSVIVYEIQ